MKLNKDYREVMKLGKAQSKFYDGLKINPEELLLNNMPHKEELTELELSWLLHDLDQRG